jgi:hypothetical protein
MSARMHNHSNMRTLLHFARLAACLFLSSVFVEAADSTRLLVTVNKKTIGRFTDKVVAGGGGSRTQTMAVSVTNQSIRPLPAGVIQWTAVVRKYSSGLQKYTGKNDLPPLLSFKAAEVSCGVFDIGTYQSSVGVEKDRIDYEIVILHDGKESYRTVSVSNFAALAEKAELVKNVDPNDGKNGNNENDSGPKGPKNPKPAEPPIAGPEKTPAQRPAVPVAEISSPAPATPVAAPPPVPQKSFDFFNLGGKKPPEAK